MRTSEKSSTIAAALYAVHRDLENPRKDAKAKIATKQGRNYEYEYLTLPALIDHAKAALKEAQVAVIQEVAGDPQVVSITTRFLHLTGEWLEVGPIVMASSSNPQELGSIVTYLRRYALAAALNLAADEDDDAQSAKLEPGPARSQPTAADRGAGMGAADGSEAQRDAAYGEGATTGKASEPPSTPSAQPAGHHDHQWAPSPTMPGWRWCTVRGCGKAEKEPAA